MSDQEKAIVVTPPDMPEEYGNREQIAALGARIKALVPGANKLSDVHAMAWAQYCMMTDTNPFRGESYAWEDKDGKFHIDDGYKVLVRWAQRQCPYTRSLEPLTKVAAGDIGYTCYILRKDAEDTLRLFVSLGASFDEAYRRAATSAVGVVTRDEMFYTNKTQYRAAGDPVAPPKGWTWDQVAQKRATKNALNLAYGMPSPKELASESWMVGDTRTRPEDWENLHYERASDREAEAEYNARLHETPPSGHTAAEAIEALYGDYIHEEHDPFMDEPPTQVEPPQAQPVSAGDTKSKAIRLIAKVYAPSGLAAPSIKNEFAKAVFGMETFDSLTQHQLELAVQYLEAVGAGKDKAQGKQIIARCMNEHRLMCDEDWVEATPPPEEQA